MGNGSNRIARDALVFLPAKLAEGIIAMATTFLFTDLFSVSAYGRFQMVHTNVLFVHLILIGWLVNSSVRYVGNWRDGTGERQFYSTTCVCYLFSAALAAVAAATVSAISREPIWFAALAFLLSYALFQIFNAMLVQCGKIKASVILSLSSAVIKLGGAYALVYALPNGRNSAYPPVLASVAADLFAGIAAMLVLGVHRNLSIKAFSGKYAVDFLKFGIPLVGFSVSSALLGVADRYMVNFLCGEEQFAVYSANNSISTGVFSLLMVGIMRGVYPNVLKAWRSGGQAEAKPLLDSGTRLYIILAMPAAFGLVALCARISLIFFTKPEYHVGIICGISALSMFLLGLTEYANKAWELTANTVPILKNSIISAVVKIAATFALIPLFGVVGAALGSLTAYAVYFVISFAAASKRFVFKLGTLSFVRIFISSVLCALSAYFVLLFRDGVISLVLAIACGAIVYAFSLIVSGEVREELTAVQKLASGLYRRGEKK